MNIFYKPQKEKINAVQEEYLQTGQTKGYFVLESTSPK